MFRPLVAIVDFHHLRGPEVEKWIGLPEASPDPAIENDWAVLPFLALPDGAHATDEELSYFTLKQKPRGSLFGIACTRSIPASTLKHKPADVTRSAVQKAIVAILDSPHLFARIREKLSAVTKAWFHQCDFSELEVVESFGEDLVHTCAHVTASRIASPAFSGTPVPASPSDSAATSDKWESEKVSIGDASLSIPDPHQTKRDHEFVGLSLREIVHAWREKTLVLFKAVLLQPRLLFFSTHCESLCLLQFSLVSLIPGLINALDDCADPSYNSYEESNLRVPENLQTSSRESLLRYMGLPLQLFGAKALFGPYTPLQQLDVLEDAGTESYLCGSTNALVLRQRDIHNQQSAHYHLPRLHAPSKPSSQRTSSDSQTPAASEKPPRPKGPDVLVNLDDTSIDILRPELRTALALTPADRRFIDLITASVDSTWDPAHPSRPNTLAFPGSEEFIRLQFEEYLLAFISAVNYSDFIALHPTAPRPSLDAAVTATAAKDKPPPLDPLAPFHPPFLAAFQSTHAATLWRKATAHAALFDIVPPLHPCAGTTAASLALDDLHRRLADLHLDARVAAVGASLSAGRDRVGASLSTWWADRRGPAALEAPADPDRRDWDKARENVHAAGQRASAYLASWGSWAGGKRAGAVEEAATAPGRGSAEGRRERQTGPAGAEEEANPVPEASQERKEGLAERMKRLGYASAA